EGRRAAVRRPRAGAQACTGGSGNGLGSAGRGGRAALRGARRGKRGAGGAGEGGATTAGDFHPRDARVPGGSRQRADATARARSAARTAPLTAGTRGAAAEEGRA